MDTNTAKLLIQLGTYGPLGVMCALFFILFLLERKRVDAERKKVEELSHKLYEVGMGVIKSDVERDKIIEPMEKVFDAAVRALAEKSHEYPPRR